MSRLSLALKGSVVWLEGGTSGGCWFMTIRRLAAIRWLLYKQNLDRSPFSILNSTTLFIPRRVTHPGTNTIRRCLTYGQWSVADRNSNFNCSSRSSLKLPKTTMFQVEMAGYWVLGIVLIKALIRDEFK